MSQMIWRNTEIFKAISKREDEYSQKIINLLENPNVLDKVEIILNSGGTTPKDFTLHDGNHSFRVAEKIWSLIPQETVEGLSSYELGFLLLSAYLHDIGMSPSFDKVERHRKYIITNNKKCLTDFEINELQKWIDNNEKLSVIDIRKETIDDEETSNYLLSYYIRYKHNDWSGEWIEDNLSQLDLYNYIYWIDDLILLCKSHHYGYYHLIKNDFDPKPINSGICIHIRYLSMCLRVADVMENDPERTPEVILNHRSVHPDSLIYWLKDKSFNLIRTENKFTVYARPKKSYIHKAVLETANMIEDELKLCEELIKNKPLNYSSFKELNYYKWEFDTYIHIDVQPKDNLYTYIQGTFRPNTAKILELLGGSKLYGDPIWTLRELIQNSFDAIKEKIAHDILNENRDPKDYLSIIGNLNSIDISLEKRNDEYWLVCKDQGVGMTKQIIEKFFLESGTSKRHEISQLERRAKEHGFNLGRTGQFGIGVLSYFMLADKLVVKTKRQLNTGYSDNESIAWQFDINGTHDFGELSQSTSNISGTIIELKLRQSIKDNIKEWDNRFKSFIRENIIYSPCKVNYISHIGNTSSSIDKYGWVNSVEDIKEKVVNILLQDIKSFFTNNQEIISSREKENKERTTKLTQEILSSIRNNIDFLYKEDVIEGVGRYRIFVPFFKLLKGNCFYYLKEDIISGKHYLHRIVRENAWLPNFNTISYSLKGIKININNSKKDDNYTETNMAYVEFDIDDLESISNSTSGLSISRHTLEADEYFLNYLDNIDQQIHALIKDNTGKFENIYDSLNFSFTDTPPIHNYWGFSEKIDDQLMVWKPIEFPLIKPQFPFLFNNYTINNKKLHLFNPLTFYSDYTNITDWFEGIKSTYTLIYIKNPESEVISFPNYFPMIEKPSDVNTFSTSIGIKKIRMPEGWEKVLLINVNSSDGSDNSENFYLNINSDITRFYDDANYKNIIYNKSIIVDESANTETCLSKFLLYFGEYNNDDEWNALCEQRSKEITTIFSKLSTTEFYIINDDTLVKISYGEWKIVDEGLFASLPTNKLPIFKKKNNKSSKNN